MTPRSIDALLFDLDGTLIDSRQDLADAVNWALGELGYPRRTLAEVTGFVGDGVRALLERALPTIDDPRLEEALKCFRVRYADHCLVATKLYPGVAEVLTHFDGAKRLAVVTNKPRGVSVKILEGLGVAPRFAAIVGGDSASRRKPHPDQIHLALELLKADPARTVMVGDRPNDILAGRAAGLMTCGVTYGLTTPAEITAAAPDHLIDHATELLGLFG